MNAIILAAGIGSRLLPLTENKPKTMVKVNDKPMLEYMLYALIEAEIKQIIICTGYKSENIKKFVEEKFSTHQIEIVFIENKDYLHTNNMYSLYLARNYLVDSSIIMNADLMFDKSIIKDIVNLPYSVVAVDKDNYIEESMKITTCNGIVSGISKTIPKEEAYGCSIDIYKFDKNSTKVLKDELIIAIEIYRNINEWTEVLFDKIFKRKELKIIPFDIGKRKWVEIDNLEDLATAEILFNAYLPNLSSKKIFIFDKDGTLTINNVAISGVSNFLEKILKKGNKFCVASNNSSKTSYEHTEQLKKIFPSIDKITVFSSLDIAISELKNKGIEKIYWTATNTVSRYLDEIFVFEEENPDAILLTYDNTINYEKFSHIIKLIRKKIPYYATHCDMLYPDDGGFLPDIGLFIKVIESSANVIPIENFGKPNQKFINYLLRNLKVSADECVIVGDRLYTDIAAKIDSPDLLSVLVLSGETTRAQYEDSHIRADIVTPSLELILDYI